MKATAKNIKKTIVTVLVALVAITSINAKTLYKDKSFELRNGHKAEVTLKQSTLVEYDDVRDLFSGKFQVLTFTRYGKVYDKNPKVIVPVYCVTDIKSLKSLIGSPEYGVYFGMDAELARVFDKLGYGDDLTEYIEVTNGVEVWEFDVKSDDGTVRHLEYIFNVLTNKNGKNAFESAVIFYEN